MYQNNYYNRNGYDNRKLYNNNYKNDVKGGYNGLPFRQNGFNPYNNKLHGMNILNNNNAPYDGYNRNNYYICKQRKPMNYKHPNGSKRSRSQLRGSCTHYAKRLCNATCKCDEEQTKVSSVEQGVGVGHDFEHYLNDKGNVNSAGDNFNYLLNGRYREGCANNGCGFKWDKCSYKEIPNFDRTYFNFNKHEHRDSYATYKYGEKEMYGVELYNNDKLSWQKKSPNTTSRFCYKKKYYRDNFHRRPYNDEYYYNKYEKSPKRSNMHTDRNNDMINANGTIPISNSGNTRNRMYWNTSNNTNTNNTTTTNNNMYTCENFYNTINDCNMSNKRQNSKNLNFNDSNENNRSYRKRAKYHDNKSDEFTNHEVTFGLSNNKYMKERNKRGHYHRNEVSRNRNKGLRKKEGYKNKGKGFTPENYSSVDQERSGNAEKKNQRNKRHRSKENEHYSEDDKKRKKEKDSSESSSISSTASLDRIVHFSWKEGMILDGVYRIERKMGDGTFGRVLLCKHLTTGKEYAIKVIRNKKRYTKSAKIEADILKKIQNNNAQNNNIVRYYGRFMHKNHMCLIFEPLGPSLYEILKKNEFRGFPLDDIKCFCIEILKSLRYLRKIRLTHTDIKPENILLDDSSFLGKIVTIVEHADKRELTRIFRTQSTGIRLIDFGCATFNDDYHGSIINTRQYRAPEVILNLGWNEASDMWSLGCVLAEMYTGYLLFKTHDHLEHLALIESRLGPIPRRMLINSLKTNGVQYIHKQELRLNWPEGAENSVSENYVSRCAPLSDIVKNKEFCEFLKFILEIDPCCRPTPTEALRHKFLQNVTRNFL